ncbi:MAG: hypothetical protein GX611_02350, partial [Clostridiales bacterium]|nr:hypothetical protein [Clostridiales bacterium]
MKINLSCPVELWHFKLPTEDYPVVRLNLFNLSEKGVASLQAALLSFDAEGNQFMRQVERVSGLEGDPRSAFEVMIAVEDGHLAQAMDFIIEKVWFEDGTVWRRGTGEMSEYKPNRLEPSRQLDLLRQLAGPDAMGYPSDQGAVWVCLCGRPNAASATACLRCERDKHSQFTRFNKAAIETLIYRRDSEMEEKALAARLEAGRMQEEREEKEKKRRKRIRNSLVALLILVLLAGAGYATITWGIPAYNYYQGEQLLAGKQFDQARERFLALGDYRDSQDLALEADYQKAAGFLQNGNVTAIKSAEDIYLALKGYKDSQARYQAAHYQRAALIEKTGDYESAIAMYESLGSFEDSAEKAKKATYDWARALMEELDYAPAREKFLALGDYEDAPRLAVDCLYLPALSHLENKEFALAEGLLKQLPDHQNARLKLQEVYYAWGDMLFSAQEFEDAAVKFLAAGDYLDAFRRASECLYEPAILLFTQGQFEKAKEYFDQILAYRDSRILSQQASYQMGKAAQEAKDWQTARDRFGEAPDVK